MGDDYDDYDCLMIAQHVAHKYNVSFSLMAKYSWHTYGKRDRNLDDLKLQSIDGGMSYEPLTYNGDVVMIEDSLVYQFSMAKSEMGEGTSFADFRNGVSATMSYSSALIRADKAGTHFGNFQSLARDYADAVEDRYIGGVTRNQNGASNYFPMQSISSLILLTLLQLIWILETGCLPQAKVLRMAGKWQ